MKKRQRDGDAFESFLFQTTEGFSRCTSSSLRCALQVISSHRLLLLSSQEATFDSCMTTRQQAERLLSRCLEAAGSPDTSSALTDLEIKWVCQMTSAVFAREPGLLELGAPIKVVGDIHGQLDDLIRILRSGGPPPATRYLFLGNYVSRGPCQIDVVCLLLLLKLTSPSSVYMLFGNHEQSSINYTYGFFDECKERSSRTVWRAFNRCFANMPIAALVSGKVFCVHAGLSPTLRSPRDVLDIKRPLVVGEEGLLCDLLWSDPGRGKVGWHPNSRGVSHAFGRDVVEDFVASNGLSLIVRGHELVEHGFEFFASRYLITVFSASDYCGEFGNSGAVLSFDARLRCTIQVFPPLATPSFPANDLAYTSTAEVGQEILPPPPPSIAAYPPPLPLDSFAIDSVPGPDEPFRGEDSEAIAGTIPSSLAKRKRSKVASRAIPGMEEMTTSNPLYAKMKKRDRRSTNRQNMALARSTLEEKGEPGE